MTVNVENMRKWIAALRSGQYTQGTGTLRNDKNQYCCLGVACEVAIGSGVELDVKLPDPGGSAYWYYGDMAGTLPPEVQRWLGVDQDDIKFGDPELVQNEHGGYSYNGPLSAIHANDTLNWSFSRIADQLEQVFIPVAASNG